MRELFDEVAGHSPLDPEEAVRRTTRGRGASAFTRRLASPKHLKALALLSTASRCARPRGGSLAAPTREIAEAIAAEWDAQKEIIDPMTMPMTRLANSVIDAVTDRVEAVADDIAKYFHSDLLFYRAGHPDALVALEAEHWDPVLFWAADTLGAHFILTEGIVHVRQPDQAVAAARAVLPDDPWSIAALHVVTTRDRLGAAGAGADARRA